MSDEPRTPDSHARVRVQVGADRTVDVEIPSGATRLTDLLPATRALSDGFAAAALDSEKAAGRRASCRAGCGACCRQVVVISMVEAQGLAELVASLPEERRATIRARFADAVRRLEDAQLLKRDAPRGERDLVARNLGSLEASLQDLGRRYFALQIACPFLENESCSIHDQRPSVCREYHVTSPAELCATLYRNAVDRVPMPVRVGDALMKTAQRVAGTPLAKIPLTLSLEWSESNGERLAATHDGGELLETFLTEL
jgi:Fe-S-cluster containining protein